MPEQPTILAFDTSAAHCAAALLSGGRIVAETFEEMSRGQVERLVPLLEETLARHGAHWQDLDAIAVGTGPGNFTGIRIAVSAARGFALALGIPAIGVTGFEALRGPAGLTDPSRRVVSLPSQRRGYGAVVQVFADCVPIGPPVEIREHEGDIVPDTYSGTLSDLDSDTLIVGHGAAGLAHAFSSPHDPIRSVEASIARPHFGVAQVAAAKLGMGVDMPRPAPLYVRPPDAAPARAVPPVL